MKNLFLASLLAGSLSACAQDINHKQVLKDVEILSSDVYEGRKTGTKENQMAADYIIKRYKEIGIAPYKSSFKQPFTFKNRQRAELRGTNVIGIIPGKKKDVVVISAHYDHIGITRELINNGADDNASGVGGLLAIAEYFKKHKPENTMIIAAFDAEESGLQGAKAFVASPTTDLKSIKMNFNMDMISHSDKHELYACGTFAYPELKKYLVTNVPDIKLLTGHDDPKLGPDDWTNQSDQGAFNAKKIPFLYFGVEDHKDYHKPTDEYSTITKDFYIAAVKTILQVINNYDKNITVQSILKDKKIMKQ
ncbi:MAG: peptidase [Sphingobacteriaceae bacterium]|jgi:Zn-dependent M28 family amino/carboxypeptidase|nr:peptidase [Sphingobacteriaceae bacterium]